MDSKSNPRPLNEDLALQQVGTFVKNADGSITVTVADTSKEEDPLDPS